ncbi:MAG: hypothetical protein ACYC35_01355 [Pirellulales bacterium]
MKAWPANLLACCGWLTLLVVAMYPIVAACAYASHGQAGLAAAAVAAGLVWAGALPALALAAKWQGSARAVAGVLLGTLFRMGVPLVGGIVLQARSAVLAQAGVFGWIVAYYLVVLAVETLLSLSLVHADRGEPKVL